MTDANKPAAWATFYPNGSTASVYCGRQPPHAEPLFRAPTLTESEREAVLFAARRLEISYVEERAVAATLRGLLARCAIGSGERS